MSPLDLSRAKSPELIPESVDELKVLDRKIVLNSMILKWDNIKDEFKKLIRI